MSQSKSNIKLRKMAAKEYGNAIPFHVHNAIVYLEQREHEQKQRYISVAMTALLLVFLVFAYWGIFA